jgi:hypothetical protein
MRKSVFALALGVLICAVPGYAIPYLFVQSEAVFSPAAAGSHSVSVRIRLHNTGDLAASCVVKVGGRKQITGVSANGDAAVSFDGLSYYKGYTVACSAN